MKKVWFTSDQHFGHSNIIKYTGRPFSNVTEMNEALIRNHNELVNPQDDVYHLGDFAFRNHAAYLRRMNGRHHLIKGNHEGNDWRDAGFIWVKDVATVGVCVGKLNDRQDFFLSHYSHRRWNRAHYGVIHLFGHSHGDLEDYYKSCDVGVDAWDYKPVCAEQLIEKFKNTLSAPHHG